MMHVLLRTLRVLVLAVAACANHATASPPHFDLLIRNGLVFDGSGGPAVHADVGVNGDRIAAIGDLDSATATRSVDASGLAVAPGFINMLSWAVESLIEDGRALSDIRQGVTLEVFGEGTSWGPLGPLLKQETLAGQADVRYPIEWTSFAEYHEFLERRGISPNVASFVGATNARVNVIGYDNRPATARELEQMQEIVRIAMQEGALGVGSSLIYAPAFFASTAELVALNRAAAPYGGMYVSHIRNEGNRLLESVDEFITITREAGVRGEIYHLKAAGKPNWGKLDRVFERIEQARAEGLAISANMYTYTAGATGLDAAMPPWVQEGGYAAWAERLRDPAIRARVATEMRSSSDDWENFLLAAGPDGTLLSGFRNEALKPLTGKTLAEVAALRGTSVEETAMDLVIEDGSRVGTIYFLMSEDNVRRTIQRDWVSFGSDAEAPATEGVFLKSNPHPRAYGTFARLLGRYVRDEQLITLPEAIRRLTSQPADNLRLRERGRLLPGHFADIVVFDPATIADHASYAQPHQYASGVQHVFVNGVQVLRDGEHTGAMPGRFLRGPGWQDSDRSDAGVDEAANRSPGSLGLGQAGVHQAVPAVHHAGP
jgi:N-acyl-D-amino-acid deacylase